MTSTDAQNGDTKSATDRSRVMTAVCVGAILRGVWGWLYLTSQGNTLRDRADPAIDRIVDALDKMRSLRTVVKSLAMLTVIAGCLFVPRAASADGFVVPWIGGNSGVPGGSPIGVGIAAGASAARVVDFDVEFGYSPSDRSSGHWRSMLTTMGNVTLGVPFGKRDGIRFRPYIAGGAGLIRSRVDGLFVRDVVTRDDLGTALGGGLIVYPIRHFGVRGDVRRFFDGHGTDYWRTSIGLVVH